MSNNVFDDLEKLYVEFGNLISELRSIDDDVDVSYYSDLIDDYHWCNVMLSNRLKKIKLD